MKNFSLNQNVNIKFGVGARFELQSIVEKEGFSRGILICDKLFFSNGVADSLRTNCKSIVGIYSDITPNPMLSEVLRATALIKEKSADFVIALGGGSSLDLAKFACSMVFADGKITDYFYKRTAFSEKHLPLIAMPTTAGTGSECTAVSVLNDDATGTKSPVNSPNFYPYMAVVDPEFTLSVPPFITAITGIDAMSHALEAYWSIHNNPISDIYAIEGLKLIFQNLEKAYSEGQNIEVRINMSFGATLAGLAFATAKTAGVHACSYPLSINHHLSHGEACAFTLDAFLLANATAEPERLNRLAKELGFNSLEAMAQKIKQMKQSFKLKTTLGQVGITDTKTLAEECLVHPLMANNPKKFSSEELKGLFDSLK